jgi:uncharacterized protein YbjT (DUF2867 family)
MPDKVAVAGPNGTLGLSVIKHLSEAGFDITLLTRNPEKAAQTYPPPIKTVKADYDSVERLAAVLKDLRPDAVVSLINRDQKEAQLKVIDAVAEAGVPHLIPSAFGIDLSDPRVRDSPAAKNKAEMEDHLLEKAKAGTFTWTGVNTGLFFDWALEQRGLPVNLKDDGKPTMVFDGGDTPFSTTTVDRIGEAVTKALLKRNELKNRYVYVHTAAVTQNQLLGYARELAPERKFEVNPINSGELMLKAQEMIRNGADPVKVSGMTLPRITFGWGLGLFREPDNELLGLSEWSEEELKAFIGSCLK